MTNPPPAGDELYQKLRAEAWIQPWLDEEELYPGQDWNMEIEKAVETTDAVIVFLSKNAVTKEGYIQAELRYALDIARTKPEETIFIIPFKIEDCQVPRRLTIYQYVDYFPESQHERALKRLLVSLKRRADSLGFKFEEPVPKVERPIKEKKPVIETQNPVPSKKHHPPTDINKSSREYYEKLVVQARKSLNPLPKIVVFCLFEYFYTGGTGVFLKDKFRDANKAAENGFLFVSDDNEFTFFLNMDDPAISEAVKWATRLNGYINDTLSDDLYEILKSEYKFKPSLTIKRYWESCLYEKSLY